MALTDNEIIKALGCCPYQRDCVSCDVNGCDNSPNHIMKFALDLINRQKAEKEALIAGQETLQRHIAEQKSEIERLQKNNILPNEGFFNLLCGALVYTKTLEEYNKFRRTFKAGAIKEFAERLKKKVYYCEKKDGKDNFVVDEMVIDNLVKEMVGDK